MRQEDTDWFQHAACSADHISQEEFFEFVFEDITDHKSLKPDGLRNAREVCAGCPVRRVCAAQAISWERSEPIKRRFGIWGGLTPYQRYKMTKESRVRCPECGMVYEPLKAAQGKRACPQGHNHPRNVDPIPDC